MKTRVLFTSIAIACIALAAAGGTYVIPAAGSGPGAYGSIWRTELAVHNASMDKTADLNITFHHGTQSDGLTSPQIAPGVSRFYPDFVGVGYHKAGAGALVIEIKDEPSFRSVAVTSRTYNESGDGNWGQDVPAYNINEALGPADIGTLLGPGLKDKGTRFNFGIFAIEPAAVLWQLRRMNGDIEAEIEVSYAAWEHAQYNTGIETFFGRRPDDTDTVYARVLSGKVFVYGSIINETGDPTYVPGLRTRDNIHIVFLGVDINEDGDLEILDSNLDGILDAPLNIKASSFPYHFRISAAGDFGEPVTYEIVSSPVNTTLTDPDRIRVIAQASDIGKTGVIKVKVTSGATFAIFEIPIIIY